jgi:aquaporin Z
MLQRKTNTFKPNTKGGVMNKYLTELIGTFFLVLTIGLSANPIAIGSILMVMIYMGGNISGAHYNPAVTLAILIRGKIGGKDAGIYMVFQVIGAVIAAFIIQRHGGAVLFPMPSTGVSFIGAVFYEVVFTFALVLVVLNVATSSKTAGNSYYGLAIGFTVLAGAYSVGALSGGAFNPAVALGPIIADLFNTRSLISNVGIYMLGPFLGAAIAAFFFKFQNPDEV